MTSEQLRIRRLIDALTQLLAVAPSSPPAAAARYVLLHEQRLTSTR